MSGYELPGQRRGPSGYPGLTDKNHPIPYGLHVPYNQGYDARSRRNAGRAEDHDSSGYLSSPSLGAQIELWITELSADFSLSGQTGQSRIVREFFPRSFNDVTLTITGNVASTQEYNRLAGFVRESHWRALQQIDAGNSTDQTITFVLHNNTLQAWRRTNRVKGGHRDWSVSGYVKKMSAGAVRYEVAPQFTIEFIVTESRTDANTGLWSEQLAPVQSLNNFLQLFNIQAAADRKSGTGFVQDPTTALRDQQAAQQKAAQKGIKDAIWSVTGAVNSLKLPSFTF